MAIDKIKSNGLDDNLEFNGTEGVRVPQGTTAQRANVQAGDIRFNTTLSLMEYYDGTNWKSIDSPPVASSVSPDNFDTAGDTITISGSNFQSGATVKIVNASGTEFTASTVTFTNSSSISFDITQAMVDDDDDPYDVMVTNPSGLSGTLADGLDFAPEPAWTVAAGSLGNIYDSARSSLSFTTGATSTEADATITYAVTTGSLPTGLSIASSTGTITGSTSSVGSDTTSTFTITATATDGNSNVTTNTRQYSITQKAPVVTSYTSTGSGTWTVPSGLTAVDVLVVAGGGPGGRTSTQGYYNDGGGGGGAGGLIYRPAFPVTPGGSVSYTVGAGGTEATPYGGTTPSSTNGQDSVFGTLTAKGGGSGGHGSGGPTSQQPSYPAAGTFSGAGTSGGSGGGAANSESPESGGTGTQPQQPGDSGTYGFGNDGGDVAGYPASNNQFGAGGGGAGAAGQTAPSSVENSTGSVLNGGIGKQYDISGSQVYYAGGGGSGQINNSSQPNTGGSGGQGGGGNGGGQSTSAPVSKGGDGTANRGGGGGGAGSSQGNVPDGTQSRGGSGGSGIIIVTY